MEQTPSEDPVEAGRLDRAASFVLEEARIVLPGIQALFGFQLIAIFNAGFGRLSPFDQNLHLAALVMTPAAYHRRSKREHVSGYFIDSTSFLLSWALLVLMLGTAMDAYVVAHLVVAHLVVDSRWGSAVIALALFLVYLGLWFVYPWLAHRPRRNRT
ncbi:DUF6328 family protein [Hypericibacter sp.]|uniref:DUF6328 family protein n=1 Tax=Hypericibacter sp. TaxID=2705401 RepID=UPI003D6D2D8E